MEKVYFYRQSLDIKLPSKRIEDGGYDIYPYFIEDYLIIPPHQTKLIPTGLKSVFDVSKTVILKERGSTGTKSIGQRAGVIDSGYRGEWLIPLTNHGEKFLIIAKKQFIESSFLPSEVYTVYPYEKAIAQAIFIDNFQMEVEEVDEDFINNSYSLRGDGKLGSSQK